LKIQGLVQAEPAHKSGLSCRAWPSAPRREAAIKAKALALRVIAEEIEHGEIKPDSDTLQFSIAA
jgi:hypothetical protein